jgi:hypothetical protein
MTLYESSFAIAIEDLSTFRAAARQISHDTVISTSGRARHRVKPDHDLENQAASGALSQRRARGRHG